MKFYLTEKKISETTRERIDVIIDQLREKGWDVSYGDRETTPECMEDRYRSAELENKFLDDYFECLYR